MQEYPRYILDKVDTPPKKKGKKKDKEDSNNTNNIEDMSSNSKGSRASMSPNLGNDNDNNSDSNSLGNSSSNSSSRSSTNSSVAIIEEETKSVQKVLSIDLQAKADEIQAMLANSKKSRTNVILR